jgi:hypothetical protein
VAEVAFWEADSFSVVSADQAIMDIRGLGERSDGGFHVCGGIGAEAEVLATNWLVRPVVGVEEQVLTGALLYPVPSMGPLVVRWPEAGAEILFRLTDLSGKVLMDRRFNGPELRLDLSGHAPGAYLVQLSSGTAVTRFRFWLVN